MTTVEDRPTSSTVDVKPRSREVTDGDAKAPARAMLRAVGMGDDDWVKPQIGVASSWNEITPCNLSLDRLAKRAKEGVHAAGGYPLEFATISVSDGISMGHEGMRASLVSREVIADSVETVMFAERLDGSVLLAGCDKSLPGMLMAAARGMLRAVGMQDEDFAKPQIGVASSWNEITPCNLSLDRLAKAAKNGVHAAGGYPMEFGTISVSDGIAMGHEGMKASLVSREVICDSIELMMHAHGYDALVGLAGCDKSLPGTLMAMARLNVPSVFLYGGTILPGNDLSQPASSTEPSIRSAIITVSTESAMTSRETSEKCMPS